MPDETTTLVVADGEAATVVAEIVAETGEGEATNVATETTETTEAPAAETTTEVPVAVKEGDVVTLGVQQIIREPAYQLRDKLDDEVVDRYSESIERILKAHPVIVFLTPDGKYILADGFHRAAAADKIGLTEIPAEIRFGDAAAAFDFACEANAQHGKQLTPQERQQAAYKLATIHRTPTGPKGKTLKWKEGWSFNKIAQMLGYRNAESVQVIISQQSKAAKAAAAGTAPAAPKQRGRPAAGATPTTETPAAAPAPAAAPQPEIVDEVTPAARRSVTEEEFNNVPERRPQAAAATQVSEETAEAVERQTRPTAIMDLPVVEREAVLALQRLETVYETLSDLNRFTSEVLAKVLVEQPTLRSLVRKLPEMAEWFRRLPEDLEDYQAEKAALSPEALAAAEAVLTAAPQAEDAETLEEEEALL